MDDDDPSDDENENENNNIELIPPMGQLMPIIEEGEEDEDIEEEQQMPELRRSTRIKKKPTNLIPSFSGQKYEETNNLNMHVSVTLEYDTNFLLNFIKTIHEFMFKQYGF